MTGCAFDAVILDFDGVIVESVDVKTQAFAALYAPYGPEVVAQVVAYHLDHGGISRFEKFRHFHREFLGKTLSPEEETSLGARFSALVEDAVVASPWVPGARDFLEAYHDRLPLFVASGTPETELLRIAERRAIRHYFVSLHGTPATKAEIIELVVQHHGFPPKRVLMVGDALSDYDGAAATGLRFIGRVTDGRNPFPPGTVTLPDLVPLPALLLN